MDEKLLIKKIENKRIYIYGAGIVGSLLLNRLQDYDIEKARINFVVTVKTSNQYKYLECDLYQIDELSGTDIEESVIIVAGRKKVREQIENILIEKNITDYIAVDDELYDEMEEKYIEKQPCQYKEYSAIDILYMASDNNISSGAFRCLAELNASLNKMGIRTLIVLPSYGNGEELLEQYKLDYIYVVSRDWTTELDNNDVGHEPAINKIAVAKLGKIIEKYNVKIVHNNTTYTYVGAVAAKEKGIPYVWHIREFIREQGQWFTNEKYAYDLINHSNYIITVSDYVGQCYKGLASDRIKRIYDGIDISKYVGISIKKMQAKLKILMPGYMTALKGQEQLIRAAVILRDKGILFEINYVGDGEYKYIAKLKEMISENHLENKIFVNGRCSNIEKWYAEADVVVVCSRAEAFGRVTVEAQLAGCIVVGADCGATCELIDDGRNGYLYELGNYNMLAEKLIEVYKNPKRTEAIKNKARKIAVGEFGGKKNAIEIAKLYSSIFNNN